MVVKVLSTTVTGTTSCGTAHFHMVVKVTELSKAGANGCGTAHFHMVVKGPLAFVWWRIALMIILIKNEFNNWFE